MLTIFLRHDQAKTLTEINDHRPGAVIAPSSIRPTTFERCINKNS
jgi:hypothetical protein